MKKSNRKILFTGLAGRSSSEIRGRQVASTNDNFYYCDQNRLTEAIINNCDEVIFVRNFVDSLARHFKSLGKTIGFDMIDRPVADVHQLYKQNHVNPRINWDTYCNLPVDYIIVNNSLTKKHLHRIPGCPSVKVIPHHTCNLERHTNLIKETVMTVGYVGLSDQISRVKEIRTWLKDRGIELLVANPKSREEVLKVHKSIDVGLIYLEAGDYQKEVLRYKPCTKIINFQSFGIPTISCEYESFNEFGSSAYLKANTLDEVFYNLEKLIKSKKERERLSLLGINNSKNFSLEKISEYYK
jgi:hypothetical protein